MKTIPDLRETAAVPDSPGGAQLRAIIVYLHTGLLPRAYRFCQEHDYEVVYLVPTPQYADAVRLLNTGDADLVVAASEDSLDPNRLPRVEVVPDVDDEESGTAG